MQTEIEYSVNITNPDEVKAFLRKHSSAERIITIARDIYKDGGKYFMKVSEETEGGVTRVVFSIKEDLMSQGIADGMKVAEELDIEISSEQLEKLTKMLMMLGFEQTSRFSKIRYQYEIDGVVVTVDEYDNVTNLEIEGPDQDTIMSVVDKIPIIPPEGN